MLSIIPIMLPISSISDLWNEPLNLFYERFFVRLAFGKFWYFAALKYVETYCADKFDKFDKIDNNNLKIDNYRLLTTYPFIDFYRFPIQLTNFIDFINCYRLSVLSIELVRWKAACCRITWSPIWTCESVKRFKSSSNTQKLC